VRAAPQEKRPGTRSIVGERPQSGADRGEAGLLNAYAVLALWMSVMVIASGMAKVRRDPGVVKVVHEVTRVPLKWFPWLSACEFAGGIGLLVGIVWPPAGLAASVALVLYFVGAVIAHLRVGDFKGLGPAVFFLCLAVACLVARSHVA
jgi:hypothetical protein